MCKNIVSNKKQFINRFTKHCFQNLLIVTSYFSNLTATVFRFDKKFHQIFLAFLFVISSLQLQAQRQSEYNVKAVFLYNFTHFIEWPSSSFQSPDAPFVIGILGTDPFQSKIDDAVSGEKVDEHPIVVQRYQSLKDLKNCHILFISALSNKEPLKIKETLATLPNKNILTVSDLPDFATNGGMIRFITKQNKIKLEINLNASKEANLQISSKLLQLAKIVR
jgi:hypothetical protein